MKKIVFLFLICFVFVLGACDVLQNQGSSSRNRLVEIFPVAEGGRQGLENPRRPLVFLKERKNQVCRRGVPNPEIYGFKEENCFGLGLKKEESETSDSNTNTGATGPSSNNENNDNANTQDNNNAQGAPEEDQNISLIDPGANWFKMGLVILNNSREDWLIIEDISFDISGRWGQEILQSNTSIDSSYCQSQTPLYIIPPLPTDRKENDILNVYEPAKTKYVNNLTLYIDGVPVPDGPPIERTPTSNNPVGPSAGSNSAGQQASRNSAGGGTGGAPANTGAGTGANNPQADEPPDPFVLDRLPNYKVKALARGYWIDSKCNTVHNFEKSFQFSLSSSFQN